ncbi:hypothetical protein GGS23DRAFT_137872 [Durotheca rogersii]|uniref:uncharacterized protein n=1 Tax=Durotheca rogersii TaxID=419775 RepID=UPI00221F3111|nr:uncharacterized protein GGS23DRAFT_137872 [Durotheca rogersii]KAI5861530.1 hypothetical protein GGS23DRAFT_137872 [Durotheca rogersii]
MRSHGPRAKVPDAMGRDSALSPRISRLCPDPIDSPSGSVESSRDGSSESSASTQASLDSPSPVDRQPTQTPTPKEELGSPDSLVAGTVTNVKHRHPKRAHSPYVWETHKAEICRLYLDENRRLKDVMEIMESRHGFRASPKMYKTKLTQWKFFKNNRQTDVANLLFLQQNRQALGKETVFRRNGKPVDIEAYMKRRGVSATDLVEAADFSELPPTVRCRTPPSVPKLLDPPGDLLVKERFLQWTAQNFVKPRPVETGYLRKLDIYHASEAFRSIQLLTHGCWLFSVGQNREGGRFCRDAFALLHHTLEASAFLSVFELLVSIRRYPNAGIMKELWSYLSRYAAMIEGMNQPLHRVLASFASFAAQHDLKHNVDAIDWVLRWSSGRFHGTFDGQPFDYTMLEPWDVAPLEQCYHRYYLCLNDWHVDAIPTASLPSLGEHEDPANLRADLLLILGNSSAWRDDRIPKVAGAAREANRASAHPSDYLEFACLYVLARHGHARSTAKAAAEATTCPDHRRARDQLQEAADLQARAWPHGRNYYETLTMLEGWLREAGDDRAAEATRKRRDLDSMGTLTTLRR